MKQTKVNAGDAVQKAAELYGFHFHKVAACRSIYRDVAAFHLSTDQGEVLLKPFRGLEHRIRRISRWMEELETEAFRPFPVWWHSRDGARYFGRKGLWFYATDWLDNSRSMADTADYRRLGDALGWLHTHQRKEGTRTQLNGLAQQGLNLPVLRRHDAQFRAFLKAGRFPKGEMGRWFRNNGKRCFELADETWLLFQNPDVRATIEASVRRPSLLHGDVTRPNVLVRDMEVFLVDWECMRWGMSLLELAKALANTCDFEPSYMKALLDGYEGRRPLSTPERSVVQGLFRLPREAWNVAGGLSRNRVRTFEVLRDFWTNRLRAIEWLDDWANGEDLWP